MPDTGSEIVKALRDMVRFMAHEDEAILSGAADLIEEIIDADTVGMGEAQLRRFIADWKRRARSTKGGAS